MNFQKIIGKSPNPYVVLDPDLTIVWANEAYLSATMRSLDAIVGRKMFDAFPSEGESFRQLDTSLRRVIATGEPDEIAHIRYDIPNPDGSLSTRYWSATHTPLLDDDGTVSLILQHTVDITEVEELRRMRDAMGVLQRAQKVEQRYAGLSEELAQWRSLLEQAPGFVAVLSGAEHRFVMANAAYRRLIGGREVIGQTVAEALPELIDQGFIGVLDQVMETGEPYFGERELVKLQIDDDDDELREMHLEFIFQPVVGRSGEVDGVLVQGHDVTEEVAADDHQRLLINELNHRVKNTLAVVQGLAHQSFRGFKDDPSLDIFSSRLAALASAHNLLTERRWDSADLAAVVQRAIEATLGPDQDSVTMSGPRVKLPPQPAVGLAMVIHELTTNAIKYGALSVPTGKVTISWTASADEDGTDISLDWHETGGPPVTEPESAGFGSRLIGRGFGVGGSKAELDFLPDGVHCHITARL